MEKQEIEMGTHAKELANQFHGLFAVKLQKLAYEFGKQNKIPITQSGI